MKECMHPVARPPVRRPRPASLAPVAAALVALAACWDDEPTKPPEPGPDPRLSYAMFPSNLTPDELTVAQNDVISVFGQPVPPRVDPDQSVNFANHFLIECVVNEDEYQSALWPPCSLAISEGYVLIEADLGRQLASFGCVANYNYVPGGMINPSVSHCAVLSGYTADQGPGVQWSGVWTVTGCEPTWITLRHTRSTDLTPSGSDAFAALSDTTRITVAQPCGGG